MVKFQPPMWILWIVVLIVPAIQAGEDGSICLHHEEDDRDHESYMK